MLPMGGVLGDVRKPIEKFLYVRLPLIHLQAKATQVTGHEILPFAFLPGKAGNPHQLAQQINDLARFFLR